MVNEPAGSRRPLKVIHVVSGDLWAGAEVATFHLLRALAARSDVDVRAVLLNPGELATRLASAGVRVSVEEESRHGFFSLARAVRRHARDVDLLHAHRSKENLLAAISGRPWVTTQHGRPEPFRGLAAQRARAFLALDLLAKRFSARRVIAVSREVEAWLASRIGAERLVRQWNGIDDPTTAIAPRPWAERPRRVGVLARLAPVKGIDLAIDAVARTPGVELEIVGDGRERESLERLAHASGAPGRIRFTGFDPNPLARVAAWRMLLVTSHHEGNPIAVIEALALGTPVLTGALEGVVEMIGAGAGRVVQDRDPSRWSAALAEAVGDEAVGNARSTAARARFVAAFSIGSVAESMVRIYRAALGSRGSIDSAGVAGRDSPA